MLNLSSVIRNIILGSIYRIPNLTAHPSEGMHEFDLTGVPKRNGETCTALVWSDP